MKKFSDIHIGLQFFAQAGDVVNATNQYVNAYTGAGTAFTDELTLSPTMKEFYDTTLLENARPKMVYAQFGKRQPLPKNHGGRVEWRKFNTFARASKLTEGVIPTGQKFGMTKIYGEIEQYGTYTSVSDRLETRAYDPIIMGTTEEMGASGAETQEVMIRDALLVNTNVLYCDNINPATGAAATGNGVVVTPTSCATMEASASAMSMLTPKMVNKAVTIMKKNRVPLINGKYFAVIHPSVAYNLREHDDWISVHKYDATTEIFNGEIGELHGVRFIEDDLAPVLSMVGQTSYKNKANGVTYATYFFGKDSFGIIDPEAGGMEMIVKSKEQIGGPLNQFSTIGYKFESNGATILYSERMLRVMSCTDFSAEDEANVD